MNKKFLIIPSWYPTHKHPIRGSFFREQGQFLNEPGQRELVVLYGEECSTPFLKLLWIYFLSLIKCTWPIKKDFVIQNPDSYGFIIPKNRRIPDKYQINLACRLYKKSFKSLQALGFTPDLIHAQSGMDAGIYAHLLSEKYDIPFVILEEQVFVFHYYSRYKARLVLKAFEAAHKTAAASYDERRQVMMNQPECNPEVIWNLVDESRYVIDLSKRKQKFTVITILNSLPIKGAIDFLEAMKLLKQSDPEIEFIMIGKGADENSADPDENLFVRKSRELGVFEMGLFLPFVPRENISKILNKAHLFVSPTIQEPHGIAVREAMMCGLPIVSTANGGVEDSITPETGIVVAVRQPREMADAILNIRNHYSDYSPEKIRELAVKQCGRETFKKSMKEFYKL